MIYSSTKQQKTMDTKAPLQDSPPPPSSRIYPPQGNQKPAPNTFSSLTPLLPPLLPLPCPPCALPPPSQRAAFMVFMVRNFIKIQMNNLFLLIYVTFPQNYIATNTGRFNCSIFRTGLSANVVFVIKRFQVKV